MIITLNERFRLNTQDQKNIALERKRKTGNDRCDSVGYHGSLQGALQNALGSSEIICEMETRDELKNLLDRIEKIVHDLMRIKE